MAVGRDAGYFRVGIGDQRFGVLRLRFDFLQFAIRAEAESKHARTHLRGDGYVQRIRAVRQLHRTMVRSAEPLPGLADAPEIAIVVFATGEKKIPAIRRPLTSGLRGRLPPAGEQRMQTGAIGGHLPDGLSAILALVHAETNGFAAGRPGREVRKSRAMRQLAELCPVGMDGIEAAAANIDDLAAIRGPRGVVANGFPHAPRLAALHRPKPER